MTINVCYLFDDNFAHWLSSTQPAFLPCACRSCGSHPTPGSENTAPLFFLATDLETGFRQALKGGGVSGENPKIRYFEFVPTHCANLTATLVPYSHLPVALHAPLFTTSLVLLCVLVLICMNSTIFIAHVAQTRGFSIFKPPSPSPSRALRTSYCLQC